MTTKFIIVLVPVFFVTYIMDTNGYSILAQVLVAGLIGAFLGIVDASAHKNDTDKTP